jgi:histidinol-phosphate/aromatic aminotransferase/cobyric acid decarboxylase-like protein
MKAKARARGRGHRRPRHGQSRPADAAAHRRQAGRGGAGPAHASLFGVQGHPRPAQGHRRLLRAPLRREARPGERDDRHARLEGRLANLAQAITSPGDIILVPNPSYPIHPSASSSPAPRSAPSPTRRATTSAGLERAVKHSVPKPLALVVNFPSNPTALVVASTSTARLVDFCRKHELFILSDLAYAEIYFDDVPPPSILEVPGAKDIAVEFTSMSKTYNMPGWRMGFAPATPRLIAALARVKSYLDYGAFTPIQVAATAALNGPQDCVARCANSTGAPRRAGEGPAAAGWDVPSPPASMFLWAPIPSASAISARSASRSCCWRRRRSPWPRHRLRRARRRACPHRAGREQPPHPPGAARHQDLPARPTTDNARAAGAEQPGGERGHERPLKIAVAGLGTVGAGVSSCCATTPSRSPRAPAADRGHRRLRARPHARPRRRSRPVAGTRTRSALAADPTSTSSSS